jgi:hypothetical protein
MLNRSVVLGVLLSFSHFALADDSVSTTMETVSYRSEISPQEPVRTDRHPKGVLMGFLAVAALGLQLRRKFRASTRPWQRIDTPKLEPATPTRVGTSLPISETRADESAVFSPIRWQQMH